MNDNKNYQNINVGGVDIKAWVNGVQFEEAAQKQAENLSRMTDIVYPHVALMPDTHWGNGSAVGSVIPTKSAIIPSTVGVDLGCGMVAVKTSLKASDLPTNLHNIRDMIERKVPHGRTDNGGKGDRGAWGNPPQSVLTAWQSIRDEFEKIIAKHPMIVRSNKNDERPVRQLCSLGTGNHFIEICLDLEQNVWIMLHSGSRGIGNSIGSYFISLAKEEMIKNHIHLIDQNLAYLKEEGRHFNDYVEAITWAQNYARINRELMMERVLDTLRNVKGIPPFQARLEAINCHHNYAQKETHFDQELWVTRKGAVRAGKGELGIIPGSMGAKSFIVRGLGNPESFESCSHGAGRSMSRTQAKNKFSVEDHRKATEGVECKKDNSVLDETPAAYKDILAVMDAQKDLVEIIYELKQILCIKG